MRRSPISRIPTIRSCSKQLLSSFRPLRATLRRISKHIAFPCPRLFRIVLECFSARREGLIFRYDTQSFEQGEKTFEAAQSRNVACENLPTPGGFSSLFFSKFCGLPLKYMLSGALTTGHADKELWRSVHSDTKAEPGVDNSISCDSMPRARGSVLQFVASSTSPSTFIHAIVPVAEQF